MSATSFCRCCKVQGVATPCRARGRLRRPPAGLLPSQTSRSLLAAQEYFRQFYPSVRSAKVITDAATGRSKGYGFVRFRCARKGRST